MEAFSGSGQPSAASDERNCWTGVGTASMPNKNPRRRAGRCECPFDAWVDCREIARSFRHWLSVYGNGLGIPAFRAVGPALPSRRATAGTSASEAVLEGVRGRKTPHPPTERARKVHAGCRNGSVGHVSRRHATSPFSLWRCRACSASCRTPPRVGGSCGSAGSKLARSFR